MGDEVGTGAEAALNKPSKWQFAPVALFALIVAAWLSFTPALFNDGDTSWHLATGQWILKHGAIPHVDPFSFTFRGHAWTAHEWLVDVLMAVAYGLAGWGAVALLFGLSAAAALMLIGRELMRWLPWQRVLALLAFVTAVLAPFMLARPHVIAWPLLAGLTVSLLHARERDDAPPLTLALLFLFWANLHASFIFGLFLAGLFALEALLASEDRHRTLIGWGFFGFGSVACSLATPHFVQGFLYPLQVSGMKALPLIQEWRATDIREDWIFVLFAAAVGVVAAVQWRRLPIIRLLLIGLLAWLAFAHARHQAVFAIVSVLLLASAAGVRRNEVDSGRKAFLVLVLGGALLLTTVRIAVPLRRGDDANYPITALSKLPADLKRTPVLNSYSFGGPLILSGVAPYIDGRSDMYGDQHTLEHHRILGGDMAALESAQKRWGIRWTILNPRERVVKQLDSEPRWQRVYADPYAVVHVRRRQLFTEPQGRSD